MRFSKAVIKYRIPILILTVILMIPSVIGMINTRVNYDMLTYLPSDMETVVGQNELLKDFDKGAFTFLIFEDMKGIVTRLKATTDVSKNYRNFSGIRDDMDGQVKFIYRTEEIKTK